MDLEPDAAAPSAPAADPGRTLAETLHRSLERDIVGGRLRPGARLDEQEVAARYGVSRTPVREAFRLLASAGLVELRSRQGAVVGAATVQQVLEMFQVMAELEGLCARLAARRLPPGARERLAAIQDRLVAAVEAGPDVFYEVNREFHEEVYEASQNEFLARQTRALRNRVAAYRRHVTHLPGRMEATIAEHAAVMDAIFRHDGEGAHRAMRDHVNLLGDTLSDFIAAFG